MFSESENSGLRRPEASQGEVDKIVSNGPYGAMALAGTALAIVVAIWVAFYLFVFLPRS
jgi:hypothetical protein